MKNLIIVIFIIVFGSHKSFSNNGWIEQNVQAVYYSYGALTDVYFLNDQTGWICGQFGLLNKTTNGGTNWIHQPYSGNYHFKKIYFTDSLTGYICGADYLNGSVLKTTNSGINWSVSINTGDRNLPQDINFINKTTGWFCAKGIYKTTNSGDIWTRYLIQGYEHFELTNISFPSMNTGYCTGYYNDQMGSQISITAKTTNSGVNWVVIRQSGSVYTDIKFINDNTGFVNGLPPVKTNNGGLTWKNIMDSTGYYILSMFFLNENMGWFGSSNSPVWTVDAGNTWINQTLPVQSNVHGIYFLNGLTGWCVGMNNNSYPKVFKTISGGLTSISSNLNHTLENFNLSQNYPNPFNPETIINYELGITNFVSLKVYNSLGMEVATLVNEKKPAGSYSVSFDGSKLSSGIYFYKLESGGFVETMRMVLLK
jgi:photosystem II stability/assembly factor-like uncharacterized protein